MLFQTICPLFAVYGYSSPVAKALPRERKYFYSLNKPAKAHAFQEAFADQ